MTGENRADKAVGQSVPSGSCGHKNTDSNPK